MRATKLRIHRLTPMPVDRTSPMSMDDLKAFIAENAYGMEADQTPASEQFVIAVTELNGGIIPDYIEKRINPDTIVSGEQYDRVYVQFGFSNGGVVKVFPGEAIPFDEAAARDAIKEQADFHPAGDNS